MKKWIWIIPFIVILAGIAGWVVWILKDSTSPTETAGTNQPQEMVDDISRDVINDPVSESIVVFKSDEIPYRNGHHFISELHEFYNNTLCWGRLATADYDRQVEQAEHIIFVIDNTEVKDKDMVRDFESIKKLAQTVIEKDDRKAMRDLHRYFHDLDIYFNGYSHKDTFRITKFRG